MRNIAEFQLIGRVGSIDVRDNVVNLSVAANYSRRDEKGEWTDDTYWNRVSIFGEKTRSYVAEKVQKGDLARFWSPHLRTFIGSVWTAGWMC